MMMMMMMPLMVMLYDDGKVLCPVMHSEIVTAALNCCFKLLLQTGSQWVGELDYFCCCCCCVAANDDVAIDAAAYDDDADDDDDDDDDDVKVWCHVMHFEVSN